MSMRFDPVTGEKIQQDSEPRQNQAAASGAARGGAASDTAPGGSAQGPPRDGIYQDTMPGGAAQ